MCELGWKSLGVLELTALPSIDEEQWVPMVQERDVLLVNGGDPLYQCYWMRQSGLADLLPHRRSRLRGHWKLFAPSPEPSEFGLMTHARLGWASVRECPLSRPCLRSRS